MDKTVTLSIEHTRDATKRDCGECPAGLSGRCLHLDEELEGSFYNMRVSGCPFNQPCCPMCEEGISVVWNNVEYEINHSCKGVRIGAYGDTKSECLTRYNAYLDKIKES